MQAKLLVIVVFLVGGAAAGGYHLGRQRGAPAPQAGPGREAARGRAAEVTASALPALLAGAQAQARADTTPLRAELRQVVREELQALRAEQTAEAEAGRRKAPEATPEEARRGEEARRASERLLQGAHATRRWTHEQADELRALMPQLDAAQREAVLRDLLPAINRGEVKLAYSGMPF